MFREKNSQKSIRNRSYQQIPEVFTMVIKRGEPRLLQVPSVP